MKPFEELTRLGKIRRQRKLILAALEQYDLPVTTVKFLADHTNTLFEIRTGTGGRYAMRIYSDGETTLKENRAEMFWLNALKQDTDIKITEPIANRNGELVTIVNVPDLPADQRCALFGWIPGLPLAEAKGATNVENYQLYGKALAQLHNHAESLNPLPADIYPKRWDKVFYYENEAIVYNDPQYGHLFSAENVALVDKIVAKANAYLARMFEDPAGRMLIHGDLHDSNVHIHKGELYLIDFEDLNLGYDTQDVAITLYYNRLRDNKADLQAAFRAGYSSLRSWPLESEEQLQTLIAARMVMFLNYVPQVLPAEDAKKYVDKWMIELEQYMQNYG